VKGANVGSAVAEGWEKEEGHSRFWSDGELWWLMLMLIGVSVVDAVFGFASFAARRSRFIVNGIVAIVWNGRC